MSWLFALPDRYLITMLLWLLAGVVALIVLVWIRRKRRSRDRKTTLVNLGLSLWFFLALLTAVELYFAVLFDTTDAFNMSNVSKVWFSRHVEPERHALQFGHGKGIFYRDNQQLPRTIPAAKHHIAFMGDSFTYGHGVADVEARFSNIVRAELQEQSPGEYLVSNLSDTGTDLKWVKKLAEELIQQQTRIDTLVYVFCPNDIESYHEDHMKLMYQIWDKEPKRFLFRDTYFFNLLYYRAVFASIPEAKNYYEFLADYYRGEPWQEMQNDLNELATLCSENQIDFRIVVFPFLQNLEEASPFDHAREVMNEYAEENSIPLLDLHPILKDHADQTLTVSRFDAHPNELAHQLAAEAILPFLLENGE